MTRFSNIFFALMIALSPMLSMAQTECEVSSLVKHLINSHQRAARAKGIQDNCSATSTDNRQICCFLKTDGSTDVPQLMQQLGGKCLTTIDDISIVTLPISQLHEASITQGIVRIEAKLSETKSMMDKTRTVLNVTKANSAASPLPQPFTGKGVVMGIMDIGFDMTHPTFLDTKAEQLRIKRLWDHLDIHNPNGTGKLPIGKEYTTPDQLQLKAHSADGMIATHGTHTLGIAAGSGYNSPYQGIAPDADICCVANIVGENSKLLPDSLEYLSTYALDALGFKYIFDYADEVGKPCVINFSEGSPQDIRGDDKLYYEMLAKLCGKGHILVSAAGNDGGKNTYIHKPAGQREAATGLLKWAEKNAAMDFIIDTSAPMQLLLVARSVRNGLEVRDTITLDLDFIPGVSKDTSPSGKEANKEYVEKYKFGNDTYTVFYVGCENAYDANRWGYDVIIVAEKMIGYDFDVDMILKETDKPADVIAYSFTGELKNSFSTGKNDAISYASIVSPASAPCVICVGSTAYRTEITNYAGVKKYNNNGVNGEKSSTSSTGPTMDHRIKPDVMAPGTNIISAYSSYYEENNPFASALSWDVERFTFNGRRYAWNTNSGTSMACPAAAGTIALWLEACPTLSPEDVLDVIAHTSRHNDTSLSYPNNSYGHGEIDAYAGLLYILKLDKIEALHDANPHNSRIIRYNGQKRISIGTASSTYRRCDIYSTNGIKLQTTDIPAGEQSIMLTSPVADGEILILRFY